MMHWMNRYFRIFGFASFLLCFGCGSDPSTHQSSEESFQIMNMTGTWNGTASNEGASGSRNITLVLEQMGRTVSGSYTCSDGTVACVHSQGSFSAGTAGATFTGGVVFTDITPGGPSCTLYGTVSGAELTAEYSCNPSSGEDPGEWHLTRQE
jgi:hypothetical protein